MSEKIPCWCGCGAKWNPDTDDNEPFAEMRAEIKREFAAFMLERRNATPREAQPGDRLCACGAVLSSRRAKCYACSRYESRNGHPRPVVGDEP